MIQLRYYQENAVSGILNFFNQGKTLGLVVLPTGAGKSYVIAYAAEMVGGNVLVLCPTKEILEQNYNKFCTECPSTGAAMFSASVGRKDRSTVTFATIGSIVGHPELFQGFQKIIIDEAHKVGDGDDKAVEGMYQDFLAHMPAGSQVVGLTATPFRLVEKTQYDSATKRYWVTSAKLYSLVGDGAYFKELIYCCQVGELMRHGFLAPCRYPRCHYGKAMETQTIDNIITGIYRNGGKAIVFTKSVKQADEMANWYLHCGMSVASLSGSTTKANRERIIKGYRDGSIRILFNKKVLEIGFDDPATDNVVLLNTTYSLNSYYQMVGRAIRPYPGKSFATIYDVGYNVKRFGPIENLIYQRDYRGTWQMHSGLDQITEVELKIKNR